jgi:peroxidase
MVSVVHLTGIAAVLASAIGAQHAGRSDHGSGGPGSHRSSPMQPMRGARHGSRSGVAQAARFPLEFRAINGEFNNLKHPTWGAAEQVMLRAFGSYYADGASAPAGADRASARSISNLVASQSGSILNTGGATDFVWQWGQFLDHDIVETPGTSPREDFDIAIPVGDRWFDPLGTGTETIALNRSGYAMVQGVRQQVSAITAMIDGSNVYGSDVDRQAELRANDGTGRLRTSDGNMLPMDESGFFVAGDVRANEQVALTAMHTLFMREHNVWADLVHVTLPELTGDQVYELARCMVAAELQAITYREFLPVLLGRNALRGYRGYRPDVDPSISNTFATAAYRVGHTMLSSQLLRLDATGQGHELGPLPLQDAFFHPEVLLATGIDPLLRGLAAQQAQAIDPYVVDDVRNFLFGRPGSGGFDLASLNIQRGRDHGLPAYNVLRELMGQHPAQRFSDINADPEIVSRLAQAYGDVDSIDAWVGLLSEPPAHGALVGRTNQAILVDQFTRLRDGDRYWYEACLPTELALFINSQTLAVVIRRNTGIGAELPEDVFQVR